MNRIGKTVNAISTWASALLILSLVAIVCYLGYLVLIPVSTQTSVITVNPQSNAGPLTYEIQFCRYTTSPATVYRSLVGVNGNLYAYPLPATGSVTVPGCGKEKFVFVLPTKPHPGEYVVKVTIIFQINAIRSIGDTFISNQFLEK